MFEISIVIIAIIITSAKAWYNLIKRIVGAYNEDKKFKEKEKWYMENVREYTDTIDERNLVLSELPDNEKEIMNSIFSSRWKYYDNYIYKYWAKQIKLLNEGIIDRDMFLGEGQYTFSLNEDEKKNIKNFVTNKIHEHFDDFPFVFVECFWERMVFVKKK